MPAYINPADLLKISLIALACIWAFNKAADAAGMTEFKV